MPADHRYKIVFQWRRPDGCAPGKDPQDWRSWRVFATWPVAYPSHEDAETALYTCRDMFTNLRHHRKVSASICPINYRPCGRAKGKYSDPNKEKRIR